MTHRPPKPASQSAFELDGARTSEMQRDNPTKRNGQRRRNRESVVRAVVILSPLLLFWVVLNNAAVTPDAFLARASRLGPLGYFGKEEALYRIQELGAATGELAAGLGIPDDGDSLLCHCVTTYRFMGGILAIDDGYAVLFTEKHRLSGLRDHPINSLQAIRLSDRRRTRQLQQQGALTDPLPQYRIPLGAYLSGFSVWITIALLAAGAAIEFWRTRGRRKR